MNTTATRVRVQPTTYGEIARRIDGSHIVAVGGKLVMVEDVQQAVKLVVRREAST